VSVGRDSYVVRYYVGRLHLHQLRRAHHRGLVQIHEARERLDLVVGGHHRWRGRFADKDFCGFVVDFTMVTLRGAQLLATRRIFHFRGALFPKASTVTQLLTLVDIYSREKMTTVEKVTMVEMTAAWLLNYLLLTDNRKSNTNNTPKLIIIFYNS
jgi:hypothetical protein